jgi:hypothetical protein
VGRHYAKLELRLSLKKILAFAGAIWVGWRRVMLASVGKNIVFVYHGW